jgi:hypothetical protein
LWLLFYNIAVSTVIIVELLLLLLGSFQEEHDVLFYESIAEDFVGSGTLFGVYVKHGLD